MSPPTPRPIIPSEHIETAARVEELIQARTLKSLAVRKALRLWLGQS
jgi:hypothetical protein